MFILGQPKSLSEVNPVTIEEINGLASFLDEQIKQGTPLELPQALPLMDLARLIRTAQDFHKLAFPPQEVVAEERPKLVIPPVGVSNE